MKLEAKNYFLICKYAEESLKTVVKVTSSRGSSRSGHRASEGSLTASLKASQRRAKTDLRQAAQADFVTVFVGRKVVYIYLYTYCKQQQTL